jgi:hypothetical protein
MDVTKCTVVPNPSTDRMAVRVESAITIPELEVTSASSLLVLLAVEQRKGLMASGMSIR